MKRVLIWNASTSTFFDLRDFYIDAGIAVDLTLALSRPISDYSLIHWMGPTGDAVWWPAVRDNEWCGRLHIGAGGFSGTYINSLASRTGVAFGSGSFLPGCGSSGPAVANALTTGQSVIWCAQTHGLPTGGTSLATLSSIDLRPWIVRNKPTGSKADFVISGDWNTCDDACGYIPGDNGPLMMNMYTVPV